MCAKNEMRGGSKHCVSLFHPPGRMWAMKCGEHIGLGQRNCQLDFGGDVEFLLFRLLLFLSLIMELPVMETGFKILKGMFSRSGGVSILI